MKENIYDLVVDFLVCVVCRMDCVANRSGCDGGEQGERFLHAPEATADEMGGLNECIRLLDNKNTAFF